MIICCYLSLYLGHKTPAQTGPHSTGSGGAKENPAGGKPSELKSCWLRLNNDNNNNINDNNKVFEVCKRYCIICSVCKTVYI